MSEQDWEEYSSLFLTLVNDSEDLDKLVSVVHDRELAIVIKFHFSNTWLQWIDSSVDALGGRTPRECMDSPSRISDLKEVLMRMH